MNEEYFDWLNSLSEKEKENYFKKQNEYIKKHYDKWNNIKFIPILSKIKNEEFKGDILSIIQ